MALGSLRIDPDVRAARFAPISSSQKPRLYDLFVTISLVRFSGARGQPRPGHTRVLRIPQSWVPGTQTLPEPWLCACRAYPSPSSAPGQRSAAVLVEATGGVAMPLQFGGWGRGDRTGTRGFPGLGAIDVTKPCKFIGFGGIGVTKPYQFIRFGATGVTKPYKITGFGAFVPPKTMHTKPKGI